MNQTLEKEDKKKKYIFQYGSETEFYESGLIALDEALKLWDMWKGKAIGHWDGYHRPQMCIWKDCDSETDFNSVLKEIDYRDTELNNGRFYQVTKTLID